MNVLASGVRKFDGGKFTLYRIYDKKGEAKAQAKLLRKIGWARVTEHKHRGRTRYAVWNRHR